MFKNLLIAALFLGSVPLEAPIANANNLEDVESNPEFNTLKQKAAQGDKEAQSAIGAMYHEGKGIPKDYKQAVAWFTKAANQGLAIAQTNLGVMYHEGEGVPKEL
jgi:TPR repeat protein